MKKVPSPSFLPTPGCVRIFSCHARKSAMFDDGNRAWEHEKKVLRIRENSGIWFAGRCEERQYASTPGAVGYWELNDERTSCGLQDVAAVVHSLNQRRSRGGRATNLSIRLAVVLRSQVGPCLVRWFGTSSRTPDHGDDDKAHSISLLVALLGSAQAGRPHKRGQARQRLARLHEWMLAEILVQGNDHKPRL